MTSLVLGGLKHCGKSTHGRLLAAALNREFIDTDQALEQQFRLRFGQALSCREIVQRYGEPFFREQEAETIRSLAGGADRGRVYALGGGAPANRLLHPEELKNLGFFIYLEIDPETAFRRIEAHGLPPFLQGPDPRARFEEQRRSREAFYRQCADLVFPIRGERPVPEVAAELLNQLRRKGWI